jgi:hypothetical protein
MLRPLIAAMLVLVAGCKGQDALVSVSYKKPADVSLTAENLAITIDDNGRSWTVAPAEIGVSDRAGREFETQTHGTLRVEFSLAKDGVLAAAGVATTQLRGDWRAGLHIHVAAEDPTLGCFGCGTARSVPLAPQFQRTVRDSVWFYWTGNGITYQVIY